MITRSAHLSKYIIALSIWIVLSYNLAQAQEVQRTKTNSTIIDWHLQKWQPGKSYGISWNIVKDSLLTNQIPTPVVVAILDTGVDTAHHAIYKRLWHNPHAQNAPNSKKKHYKYINDKYGWNFLGNSIDNQQNITKEHYEYQRIYFNGLSSYGSYKPKKWAKLFHKKGYQEWQRAKTEMISNSPERLMARGLRFYQSLLPDQDTVLQIKFQKTYDYNDLEKMTIDSTDHTLIAARGMMMGMYRYFPKHTKNSDINNAMDSVIAYYQALPPTLPDSLGSYRTAVINFSKGKKGKRHYGNPNIAASDTRHGTHVAGIVAGIAQTNGFSGIGSSEVSLMIVRVVPSDGDEHDEDIAAGIRYAVDNGAHIINMSFGKSYSPDLKLVNKAIRYAQKKDVLLVHAAGNSSIDLDTTYNYPNPKVGRKKAKNYITVGASTNPHFSHGKIVAKFSNIGKNTVDVFAPGDNIYSTLPGNRYGALSGTSMAAPVVTGLAAVLKAYYPNLKAHDLKQIIEASVLPPDQNDPLINKEQKYIMQENSISGGIINALRAFELAEKWYNPENKKL